jgi:uncharacterized protein (TIGR00251 family)
VASRVESKLENFLRPAKDGIYIQLRISPGAKNTAIKGLYGENAIKLSIAAPPSQGKANLEVEHYLARLMAVSASKVAVVKGTSSRDKLVFVRGVEPEQIRTRLSSIL